MRKLCHLLGGPVLDQRGDLLFVQLGRLRQSAEIVLIGYRLRVLHGHVEDLDQFRRADEFVVGGLHDEGVGSLVRIGLKVQT